MLPEPEPLNIFDEQRYYSNETRSSTSTVLSDATSCWVQRPRTSKSSKHCSRCALLTPKRHIDEKQWEVLRLWLFRSKEEQNCLSSSVKMLRFVLLTISNCVQPREHVPWSASLGNNYQINRRQSGANRQRSSRNIKDWHHFYCSLRPWHTFAMTQGGPKERYYIVTVTTQSHRARWGGRMILLFSREHFEGTN